MPWRQLLLESHAIAVLSATGIALLAFPGADLAKSAQPHLARMIAPTPPAQQVDPAPSKGPDARLTGSPIKDAEQKTPVAPVAETPAPRAKDASPAPARRAFEGCLHAHEQAACRRAFEAAIERQGGFTLAPPGDRLGSQRLSPMPTIAFDETPQWRRRIEAVSQEGIAFKRVRRGSDHELLIGINRDGVLGFSLEETSSGR
jgi:hypothetical protein